MDKDDDLTKNDPVFPEPDFGDDIKPRARKAGADDWLSMVDDRRDDHAGADLSEVSWATDDVAPADEAFATADDTAVLSPEPGLDAGADALVAGEIAETGEGEGAGAPAEEPEVGAVQKSGLLSRLKSKIGRKAAATEASAVADEAVDEKSDKPAQAGDLAEIERSGEIVEFDGGQIVTVGKRKFALGLLWDSIHADKSVRQQASDMQEGDKVFDLVANCKDAEQLGFLSTETGAKPGCRAAVTSLPGKTMGRSWLAAFRLGENSDFFWVAAQRDGKVYEDQIIEGADDARYAFLENLEAPGWDRVVAPDDWSVPQAETYDLGDVLDASSGTALRPVNPLKTYLPRIIALVVLLAAAGGGWMFYQDYLEEQARREAELKKQREAEVRVYPSDYPWFDAPDFPLFLQRCAVDIEASLRIIPGWKQDVIACRLDQRKKTATVATEWSNQGGTVPWLVASFAPDEQAPVLNGDDSIAQLTREIDFGIQSEELADPWDPEDIARILRRRVSTVGVDVRIGVEQSRITQSQRATLKKPVFDYHEIHFSASAGLEEYVRLFSDLPAVVPQAVVYDLRTGVWNFEIRAYHPAILPVAK